MKKAVVLLSGGIDSSTSLAIAQSEGYELYALSFDYNQRHRRELESARFVAASFKVRKHLIMKSDLREIGGSALTSDMKVPKSTRSKVQSASGGPKSKIINPESKIKNKKSEVIPVTYVPARNTIFLSFAVAWAEVIGTGNIVIGANAIDYSGYPDCRPDYLRAFQDMANLATKASVEGKVKFFIKAPLLYMKKSEIIRKGIALELDYALTWSCYDPQKSQATGKAVKQRNDAIKKSLRLRISKSLDSSFNLVPCGVCDSCLMREKGFKEAGITDPLIT
jgi:7-cyano-7-deazaguanine synthase